MGENQLALQKINPWITSIAIVTLVSLGAAYVISQNKARSPAPAVVTNVAPAKLVTALGRLEPQGKVIKLSVANAQDSRVDKLFIKEDDRDRAGHQLVNGCFPISDRPCPLNR